MPIDDPDRVYVVDPWSKYMWRHHVSSSSEIKSVIDVGRARYETFPAFARELFARLFSGADGRVPRVRPEDAWQQRAHDELSNLPGFVGLKKNVAGDRVMAGTAAAALAERLLQTLPAPQEQLKDAEPLRAQANGMRAILDTGIDDASLQQALADVKTRGQAIVAAAGVYADGLDETELRSALREAVDAAQNAASSLNTRINALSGFGSDNPPIECDSAKEKLANRLKGDERLQKIADEAGRMRRIAAQKRRSRSEHARDELASIERGSDLARILPSELARLAVPTLFPSFARDFLEGSLLQYAITGKEAQGRGPVVVCIDSSGSMEGAKDIWAKAVALALVDIAMKDGRAVRIVHFDDEVRRVDDFRPQAASASDVLASMSEFFGGGTDFERPLSAAIEAIDNNERLARADIVFITDGEASVSEQFLRDFTDRKTSSAISVYGVSIAGRAPAILTRICDTILNVSDLKESAAAEALFDGVSAPA